MSTADDRPGGLLSALEPGQLPAFLRQLASSLAYEPRPAIRPRPAEAYDPAWLAEADALSRVESEDEAQSTSTRMLAASGDRPATAAAAIVQPGPPLERRPERPTHGPRETARTMRPPAGPEPHDSMVGSRSPMPADTADSKAAGLARAARQRRSRTAAAVTPPDDASPAPRPSIGARPVGRVPLPALEAGPAKPSPSAPQVRVPSAEQAALAPRQPSLAGVILGAKNHDRAAGDGSLVDARDEPEPVVRVTIGRIDVRAVVDPPRTPMRARQPRSAPALSLDEYLRQRRQGER